MFKGLNNQYVWQRSCRSCPESASPCFINEFIFMMRQHGREAVPNRPVGNIVLAQMGQQTNHTSCPNRGGTTALTDAGPICTWKLSLRPSLFSYILFIYTFRRFSMKTAKLFRNGQSQAVRLPKEFRIEGTEVFIRKCGNVVMLIPAHASWDNLFQGIRKFSPDFMDERQQPSAQNREEF